MVADLLAQADIRLDGRDRAGHIAVSDPRFYNFLPTHPLPSVRSPAARSD